MSEERRVHPRVEGNLPCVLRTASGQDEHFDLLDLSESGARIRCPHAMAAMTEIAVHVDLPGARIGAEKDLRLKTRGVVVWSHPTADGRFDTGVFFPELDDESRAALQAYVLSAV